MRQPLSAPQRRPKRPSSSSQVEQPVRAENQLSVPMQASEEVGHSPYQWRSRRSPPAGPCRVSSPHALLSPLHEMPRQRAASAVRWLGPWGSGQVDCHLGRISGRPSANSAPGPSMAVVLCPAFPTGTASAFPPLAFSS